MEWAAVVLSGGGAERLGGLDKGSLDHDGRTLLDHALEAVAGADEIVVVGPAVSTGRPVRFTRESPPGGGPLAGLSAGVAALTAAPELVAVLAVDMPHVTSETIDRLLRAAADAEGAWLVDPAGRRQLAGVVRSSHVPAPDRVSGLPMRRLMERAGTVEVASSGHEADDVDTWADVARLNPGADGSNPPGPQT